MALRTPVDHYAVLGFEAWNAAGCKAAKAEALGAGRTPVLRKEWDEARAIADALLTHATAGPLLSEGDAEQSMFWRDPEFGIWLRGRMDLYRLTRGDVPTVVDVKSSRDAGPDAFAKSAHDYGYFRQDPHYREGVAALLGCDWRDVDFVFAVVESEPPYLVACYRLHDLDLGDIDVQAGREQCRIAREVYADCTGSGQWPGYSEEIENLSMRYYDRKKAEMIVSEWHR